jgi:hypothetical protein
MQGRLRQTLGQGKKWSGEAMTGPIPLEVSQPGERYYANAQAVMHGGFTHPAIASLGDPLYGKP